MLHTVLLVGLALYSHVTGDSGLKQPYLEKNHLAPTLPDNQQLNNNNPKLFASQGQQPLGQAPPCNTGSDQFGAISWQARIDPYIFIGPVLSFQPIFGNGPVPSYAPIVPPLNGFGLMQFPAVTAPAQVDVLSALNAILRAVPLSVDLTSTTPSPSNPTTTSDAASESTLAINAENASTTTANILDLETPKYPKSCAEATAVSRQTGVYTIQFSRNPIQVFCEERILGGGWVVIQRRQSNSTSFERVFAEYRTGFGNVISDYWIGLENLHKLTTGNTQQELLVAMMDYDGNTGYAMYDHFEVGSEEEGYSLKSLGRFVGNVGDSLRRHEHQKFSTKDLDRDTARVQCAEKYSGAWWYHCCYDSNLNGRYGEDEGVNGIVWNSFHRHGSLKAVQMMIRPQVKGKVVLRCKTAV